MRRCSILGLMGSVVVCGVGLAALRNADPAWAGIMFLLAAGVLATAVAGVIYLRGRDRAWWGGFALFGGGYFALAFAPWLSEAFEPRLGTTTLLEYLHSRVERAAPAEFLQVYLDLRSRRDSLAEQLDRYESLPSLYDHEQINSIRKLLSNTEGRIAAIEGRAPNPAARWRALLPGAANSEPFRRVGHCLFALAAGLVGSVVSCRFHARTSGRTDWPSSPADAGRDLH
jgi:hypothetical protein